MIPLLALAACLAVGPDTDRIVARDLVPAYPEMGALDPGTPLGYAPAPGVARVFRATELRSLAARFSLPAPADREICLTRPVAPLDPARLLAALRSALPGTEIELLEYSRQPAPAGEIEFTPAGLHGVSLWRGAVRYAGNRRFAIWARVRIAAAVQRGQTVRVDVTSGAAHLQFEGVAQSAGILGSTIAVLNPASRKPFQARVTGQGRVSVESKVTP